MSTATVGNSDRRRISLPRTRAGRLVLVGSVLGSSLLLGRALVLYRDAQRWEDRISLAGAPGEPTVSHMLADLANRADAIEYSRRSLAYAAAWPLLLVAALYGVRWANSAAASGNASDS